MASILPNTVQLREYHDPYFVKPVPMPSGPTLPIDYYKFLNAQGVKKVSTFEQAFKMVSVLIEKGHIKDLSATDLVKLVKELQKELED